MFFCEKTLKNYLPPFKVYKNFKTHNKAYFQACNIYFPSLFLVLNPSRYYGEINL